MGFSNVLLFLQMLLSELNDTFQFFHNNVERKGSMSNSPLKC